MDVSTLGFGDLPRFLIGGSTNSGKLFSTIGICSASVFVSVDIVDLGFGGLPRFLLGGSTTTLTADGLLLLFLTNIGMFSSSSVMYVFVSVEKYSYFNYSRLVIVVKFSSFFIDIFIVNVFQGIDKQEWQAFG